MAQTRLAANSRIGDNTTMTTTETQLISCPSCGAANRVQPVDQQNVEPVCGRCKTPLSTVGPVTVTDANFSQEVEKSPLPVLLDMWAPWCPPCRMIAPIIEELASELAGRVRVGKLNTDENQQIAAQMRVQSIPAVFAFVDGQPIDGFMGALPEGQIRQFIDKLGSKGSLAEEIAAAMKVAEVSRTTSSLSSRI